MPLSLIEAQAAGLPIVSTSTGGVPYIVEHDRTGLLVSPGNCDELAAAALRVLNEPGLAARLSRAAREACDANYTWQAVEKSWLQLYRDVAQQSRSRGMQRA
jgi:glycosyltransferase involved in cell wall biosynthesis